MQILQQFYVTLSVVIIAIYICKLLIFSHKVAKQWRDYQLFREFSYPELALLEGASGALSISVSTRALATTPSKRTLKKWNCVGAWTAVWSWRESSPKHCFACRTSGNSVHAQRWTILSSVCLSHLSLRWLWDSRPWNLSPKGLLDLWFFRPSYNVFNDTNSGVWAKVNQRSCAC